MSLIVRPISAQLNSGTDLILFKKDPFVICQVGGETYKTMADKNGGKNPKWADTLVFKSLDRQMRITLCDDEFVARNKIIGQGTFDLTPAYQNPGISDTKYIDIMSNGKTVARVQVQIEYQGPPMGNSSMSNMQYNQMSNILSSGLNDLSQNANKKMYNPEDYNINNNNKIPVPIPIPVPVPILSNTNNKQNYGNTSINYNVGQQNNMDLSQLGKSHISTTKYVSSIGGSDISSLGSSHLHTHIPVGTTYTPVLPTTTVLPTKTTIINPTTTTVMGSSTYYKETTTTITPGYTEVKITTSDGTKITRQL